METTQDTLKKNGKKLAPALIAAGAAAAAAGYYFYGSKSAAKNRKKAAKWAGDMKSEVMKGVRDLQKVDKRKVLALIDTAANSYEKVRSIRRDDIVNAASELRDNWERLVSESRKGKKAVRRTIAKASSRAKSASRKRKASK